jgi:hypothetical protein
MRSNDVDFQTKSAEKLWVQSEGTPSFLRSSSAISSETSIPTRQLQYHLVGAAILTVGDLDNVPKSLPRLVHLSVVPQPELVSHREPHLSRLELWQVEPGDALLVQSHVPANDERLLGLRLLQTLVVVSFDLDEGSKDILVLVRILVAIAGKV